MREEILATKLVKEVKFRVDRVAGEALVLQVLREIISKIHKGSLQENARTSNFDFKIGRSSKLLEQLVVGRNGLSVRLWCSKCYTERSSLSVILSVRPGERSVRSGVSERPCVVASVHIYSVRFHDVRPNCTRSYSLQSDSLTLACLYCLRMFFGDDHPLGWEQMVRRILWEQLLMKTAVLQLRITSLIS
ncbi:hypothetical protein LR48_Vigan01g300500 [Vigna angularis]|uniref:Uncharacterized protein n=1 Tax=Phaseolus angularis TaxID=3914 RepID=A0A0L9TTH8_PHAAN|nr:hypothetical protein LR48_Vigan01g300500 [Vigna angularis]